RGPGWPCCPRPARTASSSTSRPTISTCPPSSSSRPPSRPTRGRCSSSATTAPCSSRCGSPASSSFRGPARRSRYREDSAGWGRGPHLGEEAGCRGPAGEETLSWRQEEFVRSLTDASAHTVAAYTRDLADFVEWAERAGRRGPEGVDRLLLRRYLAYLGTRRYARRTVARKLAGLRRYFGWLRHAGILDADPSRGVGAPRGEARLPHVLRQAELDTLFDPPP